MTIIEFSFVFALGWLSCLLLVVVLVKVASRPSKAHLRFPQSIAEYWSKEDIKKMEKDS